jgi:UPF0271 protein
VKAPRTIDITADIGEGADDAAVVPLVTSGSVACGGHAGDADSMAAALRLLSQAGARAGAHPGYPDRASFGRVSMEIDPAALRTALGAQVQALAAVARRTGTRLTHVKAHGALYNRAWDDEAPARILAEVVRDVDPGLAIICPADSAQSRCSAELGQRVLREVFLDRAYDGGRLRPRTEPGAMITSLTQLEQQLEWLATVEFDTMCVHGDNPSAPALLARARALLPRFGMLAAPYSL